MRLYACIDVLSSSYTVNAHVDTHNQIWRDINLFKYMIHVKTFSYANTSFIHVYTYSYAKPIMHICVHLHLCIAHICICKNYMHMICHQYLVAKTAHYPVHFVTSSRVTFFMCFFYYLCIFIR